MRTVGLITEYNPFHNGHLHHLRESKRLSGADVSVAVMSGHFLQRGEAALLDKWTRTRMALAAGVDVVIELPFPWACNSAPVFAAGAIQCLDGLGGIDVLCFGSESGSIESLQAAASLLIEHAARIEQETAGRLRQGVNYPTARAQIVAALADERMAALLASPNNILGIEYLKALRQAKSAIQPLTIPRVGAGYHAREAVGKIASATGIRQMLGEGKEVAGFLPRDCATILAAGVAGGKSANDERFHLLLLGAMLQGVDDLQPIYQVDNGLEHRLFEMARCPGDLESLIAACKSRQLTRTRVQRILCYVLNRARRTEMEALLEAGPRYLHLLGYSDRGRKFLAASRKNSRLPIVQNYGRIFAQLKKVYGSDSEHYSLAEMQVAQEVRASRIYSLLMKDWADGDRNRDFFMDVVTS